MNRQELLKTIELAKTAQSTAMAMPDGLNKSWTQSGSATTGLTFYDLQAPALMLVPQLTPLRNIIPRVGKRGGAGIQANWKAITGINTGNTRAGVSEGNRGAVISHTFAEYLAAYRGMGLEDFVTFEADYAAQGFDDADARAVVGTLNAVMIAEETAIVGGNTSVALGTTPTPTLAASASGGTLATQTLSVICVALGYRAFWELAGYNNGSTGSSLGLTIDPNGIAVVTKTNADGSSDTYNGGVAQKSANATVSVTGATGSATSTVAPVPGAVAYAWYWNTAGSEQLGAITTVNSVSITAAAASGITVGANLAADHSTSALDYDGLLYQSLKPGSGAYVKAQATGTAGVGTKFTGNGGGGVVEIDNLNQDRWNLYRLSMNELWCNAQEMQNLSAIVVANGGAPLIRIDVAGGANAFKAGTKLGTILNTITGEEMQCNVHPNMPPGMIFTRCNSLPYKLSGVTDIIRMLVRQEYYQMAWPVVKRRREYGVYVDEVLQNFFPPATGVLYNAPNAH